jgi:hypothetical protein
LIHNDINTEKRIKQFLQPLPLDVLKYIDVVVYKNLLEEFGVKKLEGYSDKKLYNSKIPNPDTSDRSPGTSYPGAK